MSKRAKGICLPGAGLQKVVSSCARQGMPVSILIKALNQWMISLLYLGRCRIRAVSIGHALRHYSVRI